MIRALYTAASGMNAQQANIDNIAHNLANVNTTGFKKARVEFEDLVYQQIEAPGTPNSTSTRDADRPRDRPRHARRRHRAQLRQPATCKTTNGPLDIAIEGQGFFQVTLPGGQHRLHARRRVPHRTPRAAWSPPRAIRSSRRSRFRPTRRRSASRRKASSR